MSDVPLVHPLKEAFFTAVESVTSSLSASSQGRYRTTVDYFLRYLGTATSRIQSLSSFGGIRTFWAGWLLSRPPTGQKHSLSSRDSLRRVLEELAWLKIFRPARLFHPDDIPRLRSPVPAAPDSRAGPSHPGRTHAPQRCRQQCSPVVRHTGIRIGECADLPFDCLRPIGSNSGPFMCPWESREPNAWFRSIRLSASSSIVSAFFRSLDPVEPDGRFLARRNNQPCSWLNSAPHWLMCGRQPASPHPSSRINFATLLPLRC